MSKSNFKAVKWLQSKEFGGLTCWPPSTFPAIHTAPNFNSSPSLQLGNVAAVRSQLCPGRRGVTGIDIAQEVYAIG